MQAKSLGRAGPKRARRKAACVTVMLGAGQRFGKCLGACGHCLPTWPFEATRFWAPLSSPLGCRGLWEARRNSSSGPRSPSSLRCPCVGDFFDVGARRKLQKKKKKKTRQLRKLSLSIRVAFWGGCFLYFTGIFFCVFFCSDVFFLFLRVVLCVCAFLDRSIPCQHSWLLKSLMLAAELALLLSQPRPGLGRHFVALVTPGASASYWTRHLPLNLQPAWLHKLQARKHWMGLHGSSVCFTACTTLFVETSRC